jgi:hypothetical protein
MRILFCGDRNWTNYKLIADIVADFKPDVVIEGEARGADSMARDAAEYFGIPVEAYPANWEVHGKAAGPIRNTQMLKEGKPDLVVAFHNDLQNSKGTLNMVTQARKQNIKVYVYTDGGLKTIYQPNEGFFWI